MRRQNSEQQNSGQQSSAPLSLTGNIRQWLGQWGPDPVAWLIAAVGAAFYISYSVAQWRGFVVPSWDLRIFTQLAQQYAHGNVPIVRALTAAEVDEDYEHFTGVAIVERLRELGLDPLEMPAVFQIHHAPFTFGKNAMDSLTNSIALEMCAQMALASFALNPALLPIPAHILEKHHLRKHGPGAYYGQK